MNNLFHKFTNNHKPVLLLIHGFLGSMQQWKYLEKELLKDFSILKVDLPGHGQTSEFTDIYSLEDLIDRVDHILQLEKIDQIHILGHSMGGYIGAAFAKARPQQTLSLTLLNSIAGADSTERKIVRNRSLKLIEKHQEAYVNMAINNLFTFKERENFIDRITEMKQKAHNISIQSIIQALNCMRDRESSLHDLKDKKIKVSYIYGSADQIIEPSLVSKECQFLQIKGKLINCGHMSLLTNEEKIAKKMHFIE